MAARLTLSWLAVLLAGSPAGMTAPAPAPRIALLDLTTAGNSHRDQVAALNFTAALQAELSSLVDFDWIERAELGRLEAELEFSGSGFVDPAHQLKLGRWAKADLLLLGRFHSNQTNTWQLVLEIIDPQCADLLSSRLVPLKTPATQRLRDALGESVTAAREARQVLAEGTARWREGKGRRRLALLSFEPEVPSPPASEFDHRFRSMLVAQLQQLGWRTIAFSSAADAMDESALALTGLVDADPNAWRDLARIYLWGQFALLPESDPNRPFLPRQTPSQARVTLDLWTIDGARKRLTNSVSFGSDQSALGTQIAEAIREVTAARANPAPEDFSRRQISTTLMDQANRLRSAPWWTGWGNWDAPEARPRLVRLQQHYEAACFFDPGSEPAAFAWLSLRWGSPYDRHVKNPFWFQWRGAEAYGRYVQRYGLTNEAVIQPFVAGTASLLDTLTSGDRIRRGMPDDLNRAQLQEWIQRWTRELDRRKKLVENFGNSHPPGGNPTVAAPAPKPSGIISLPRTSAAPISSIRPVLLFDLPPLKFEPEQVTTPLEPIRFPPEFEPVSITGLAYAHGSLWILAQGKETLSPAPDASTRNVDIMPEVLSGSALWRFRPADKSMMRAGSRQDNQLNDMQLAGGSIWVAAAQDRVAVTTPHAKSIDLLPVNSPPADLSARALGANSRSLFVMGMRDEVQELSLDSRQWRMLRPAPLPNVYDLMHHVRCAADEEWLVAGGRQVTLLSLFTRAARNLDDAMFAPTPTAHATIHCAQGGKPGEFWIGSAAGLHHLNAKTGTARNWYVRPTVTVPNPLGGFPRDHLSGQNDGVDYHIAKNFTAMTKRRAEFHRRRIATPSAINAVDPTSRLPGPVTAVCPDGDYVWVGCALAGGGTLAIYHQPTDRWLGQVRVGAAVISLAASATHVWIGLSKPASTGWGEPSPRLLQLSKSSLLESGRPGIPDAISPELLQSQIRGWTARERATYAFFRADYAEAVRQWGEIDVQSADFETLLLAGLAHDEWGLNQPDLSRRYLQAIIDRDHRGIIATAVRTFLPAEANPTPNSPPARQPLP